MYDPHPLHCLLEDLNNIHMELEETWESYEILISDLELIVEEIAGDLERIRSHLDKAETAVKEYNFWMETDMLDDTAQELPWE